LLLLLLLWVVVVVVVAAVVVVVGRVVVVVADMFAPSAKHAPPRALCWVAAYDGTVQYITFTVV